MLSERGIRDGAGGICGRHGRLYNGSRCPACVNERMLRAISEALKPHRTATGEWADDHEKIAEIRAALADGEAAA
jgi:hypothetical protein